MSDTPQRFTWTRGSPRQPSYECSSAGDNRFSALYARLPDGRTVEQHYQCDVKGHDPGGTDWRLGKGKPPVIPMTLKQSWEAYLGLWRTWARANPALMHELRQLAAAHGYRLSDRFAKTPINQANALATLLNEKNQRVPISNITYAGIGSRETPDNVLAYFTHLANYLGRNGWTLRSGGAPGADTAFEQGAIAKEIFIPWNGFQQRSTREPGVLCIEHPLAREMAEKAHPNWAACSQGARTLHTRNVYQVLGATLGIPSRFVVCWTKGGTGAGGTGQALRIARAHNIPIFDFGRGDVSEELYAYLNEIDPEGGNL